MPWSLLHKFWTRCFREAEEIKLFQKILPEIHNTFIEEFVL